MTFEKLFQLQSGPLEIINRIINNKKLSHAYIYEGNNGCGIKEAAIYFSCKLLCDDGGCLKCDKCHSIIKNSHINVITVVPDNNMIKKEQITELIEDFNMSSLIGGARIGIIEDADKMNTSASNALLKFLEEPIQDRYIVLLTNNKKKLLDTIVSRCQVIKFNNIIIDEIVEEYKIIDDDIDKLYILANITSDIDSAKELNNDSNFNDIYNLAKTVVFDINKGIDPYINFMKNKECLDVERNNHYLFLMMLMIMTEEHVKKINKLDCYFNNINIYDFDLKDLFKQLEIFNKYLNRFYNYVNPTLQYASMFIELERR